MAYFSNSSEGDALLAQCQKCKYGKEPCPILWIQTNWNYEACNNKTAREIMDYLINQDGTCAMYKAFEKDFGIPYDVKNQYVIEYQKSLKKNNS